MNILIDLESYRKPDHLEFRKRSFAHRFLVIEQDDTEDGRLIAKFELQSEMMAVIDAMGWTVTDNLISDEQPAPGTAPYC